MFAEIQFKHVMVEMMQLQSNMEQVINHYYDIGKLIFNVDGRCVA
jgi:hypothetical protein